LQKEYLLQLKSFHEVRKPQVCRDIREVDVVLIQEDVRPRHMWRGQEFKAYGLGGMTRDERLSSVLRKVTNLVVQSSWPFLWRSTRMGRMLRNEPSLQITCARNPDSMQVAMPVTLILHASLFTSLCKAELIKDGCHVTSFVIVFPNRAILTGDRPPGCNWHRRSGKQKSDI
jgi:hypothetical protein